MAYAELATVPVTHGLFTAFIGPLVYWLFGTSKDISLGPVAAASIVAGNIISEVKPLLPDVPPALLACSLSLLTGIVIASCGLARLGWVVDIISLSVVNAFITASAVCTSVTGTLPHGTNLNCIN